MKKLTLVRILTVFIVTSAVILSNSSTVQGTPLFFDFLKRTFGGKGKAPKPASNQRPQGSAWATGGQYQKEKKFPWDIFGIFGYKNVIRPNNRPRPQRPGPPYRPPRFLVLHVKTYHIQTLCSKWEIYYFILFCHSNCFFIRFFCYGELNKYFLSFLKFEAFLTYQMSMEITFLLMKPCLF